MPGVIDWMIRSKALFCFSEVHVRTVETGPHAAKATGLELR